MANDGKSSGMAPVRLVAAHELVLEQIRTAIALGRYRPGESLPPERALADFLHVSRTTVREAVAILVEEGLIEIKRGRGGGLFVCDLGISASQTRRALKRHRDEILKVFEFRIVVESACAEFAATRRTASDIRELRRIHGSMSAMKGPNNELPSTPADSAHFHSLDTDFHLAIARASRNPWLESAALTGRVEMFRPVGSLFNSLHPTGDYLHDAILDAIETQEPAKAGAFMTEHIRTTCDVVESWVRP